MPKHQVSEAGKAMLKYQEELAVRYHYQPIQPNLIDGDVRETYASNLPAWCTAPETKWVKGPLETTEGTLLCTGWNRLVIGDYGAFIEITPEQICASNLRIQPGQEYRVNDPRFQHAKYIWMTATDTSGVKVYWQKKRVSYADYHPEYFYVSPYCVFPKN